MIALVALLAPIGMWPPQGRAYDYCATPAAHAVVDRYRADPSSVKLEPFALPKQADSISPPKDFGRITLVGSSRSSHEEWRVILVPVGYPAKQIDERMHDLAGKLRSAFRSTGPIRFGYVFPSVDLAFSHVDRLLVADAAHIKRFWEQSLRLVEADALIFVLNSDQYVAGAYVLERYAIVAGQADLNAYLIVHETAHLLGLDDGYDRYYGASELPGTELFFDVDSLPGYAAEAYRHVRPKIERAGICGDKSVYRFVGSRDTVMARGSSFNNVQRFILRRTIQDRISKKQSAHE